MIFGAISKYEMLLRGLALTPWIRLEMLLHSSDITVFDDFLIFDMHRKTSHNNRFDTSGYGASIVIVKGL